MTFQVGEKVVYPNYGVATIENISSRTFEGQLQRYYLLRLTANCSTVMVPLSHAANLRLRRVTRNGQLARVVSFLSDGRCRRFHDWKDRFKENTEKMRDGSLLGVAEVLKSLLILRSGQALSFREKKMLDRARHMLTAELSTSRQLSEGDAAGLLEEALSRARLHLPEKM